MSPASSPQSARAARPARGAASSPRAKAICGDPAAPSLSSSLPPPAAATIAAAEPFDGPEHGGVDNVGTREKKPAWNVPSNGGSEAGLVMDAISWPALSEATRASLKSSSSEFLKSLSGVSISATSELVSASAPMELNASQLNPSSEQKHSPNHPNPIRRGGGNVGGFDASDNGGSPQHRLPRSSATETHQSNPEFSPDNVPNKNTNNWDHGPRNGDHHRGNSSNRQGSSGSGRYRNRRDHERGGHNWNSPRNPTGRYSQSMLPQQQGSHPRPFLRPSPPVLAPYIAPPLQFRPFMGPMAFPEMPFPLYISAQPPFESLRSMPIVAQQVPNPPAPGMFLNAADHQLAIVKQIDYYFSSENLCKDIYLRKNMDEQGWVPISVIANFNRVKQLTNNLQYILDVLQGSSIVEVQGENIRRRNDWVNWILPPPSNQSGAASEPDSASSSN